MSETSHDWMGMADALEEKARQMFRDALNVVPRTLPQFERQAAVIADAVRQLPPLATEMLDCPIGEMIGTWYPHGMPIFELTGGLATALCLTDCRDLSGKDFKAPFNAFAVQMPQPSPLVLGGNDVAFLLVLINHQLTVFTGIGLPGHMPYAYTNLPDQAQSLNAFWSRMEHPHIFRFVANLCAWLNSLQALPTSEGRRRTAVYGKKRDHEPRPPQRWVLGRDIKLSAALFQAARSVCGPTATAKERAQYRLHARFTVRGHFHWYRVREGVDRAGLEGQWRHNFVEPYYKGPEMAAGLRRLYAVKE